MPHRARRVAVVGVSSAWGNDIARKLERDPDVEYVAGFDSTPPSGLDRTEFIEADVRSPVLSRLLPSIEVDTVVHCGVLLYPEKDKPARALHEINVIGTLQLLAACERAPTLRRVVVRGSAAIYGVEPTGPAFYTEDLARRMPLRTRFQRDVSELEQYFENFAARHPRLTCCMLRYQAEIGAEIDTPLVRYLTLPVVPTQLGYDPRLQLLHEQDATAALAASIHSEVRGPVNVGAEGVISLSRLLRLARRPTAPLPHPLFAPALRRLGQALGAGPLYGDAVRLLRYGRGVDITRLRRDVGFEPRFSTAEAVRDFVEKTSSRRVVPALHPGELAGRFGEARE